MIRTDPSLIEQDIKITVRNIQRLQADLARENERHMALIIELREYNAMQSVLNARWF